LASLRKQKTGYVYVDRDRGLNAKLRETQGNLTGGEISKVPNDKVRLFMLRTDAKGGKHEAWWPEVHFPDGRYVFAFSL
jgi:hypothetical protein